MPSAVPHRDSDATAGLNLCLITYCTVTREGTQWLVNDRFGSLVDGLAPHFRTILFVAGGAQPGDGTFYPGGRSLYTYAVRAANVRLVETAFSPSEEYPWVKAWTALRRLRPYWSAIKSADFVYVTLPGFSGIIATLMCRVLRRPYGLYFGSDWAEIAPFAARWPGGLNLLYRMYRALGWWTERAAVKGARFSAVHGRSLFERFQRIGRQVVEPVPMLAIGPDHAYHRMDTCGGQQITLLYVGALLPRKGLEYLVEALAALVKKGYRVRLDLVGPPEAAYQNRLADLVRVRGLTESVRFAGYITDLDVLLKYYRGSDIFVLPTLGEGFPRVLYEAASQGLPIVTTSIQSIAGALRDGDQALLVPPKDPVALADAIQRVIENGPLRQDLIRSGYAFAASRIGRRTTADQVIELVASSRRDECGHA